MIILFWMAWVALVILLLVLREERLVHSGQAPIGRIRRLFHGPDRRRHPRFRLNWPVKYKRTGAVRPPEAATQDLSIGGAQLILEERLEPGVYLEMELYTPEGKPIPVEGHVVWAKSVPSADPLQPRLFLIGIQFAFAPPELKARLNHSGQKPDLPQ